MLSDWRTTLPNMLSTNQKGAIPELAIMYEAAKLGIDVYVPAVEHSRCDLIFDVGTRLLRVQCKWALLKDEVLIINSCSNRRGPDGFIKRPYTPDQIDAYAVYSGDLDRCFYLPIERF